MEITEVRITLNKGGKIKAFAQIVIDNCFLVGDIRVLEGKEGTAVVAMPSRRLRNGGFRDVAHPLNTETRRRIDEAVLAEYRKAVDERGEPSAGAELSRVQAISGRLLSEKYWTDEEQEEE